LKEETEKKRKIHAENVLIFSKGDPLCLWIIASRIDSCTKKYELKNMLKMTLNPNENLKQKSIELLSVFIFFFVVERRKKSWYQ